MPDYASASAESAPTVTGARAERLVGASFRRVDRNPSSSVANGRTWRADGLTRSHQWGSATMGLYRFLYSCSPQPWSYRFRPASTTSRKTVMNRNVPGANGFHVRSWAHSWPYAVWVR